MDRLLQLDPCDRFGHRGAGEIKLHPWFKGLDWTSLARTKAAFIPAVENETDTSYFFDKPVRNLSKGIQVQHSALQGLLVRPAQPIPCLWLIISTLGVQHISALAFLMGCASPGAVLMASNVYQAVLLDICRTPVPFHISVCSCTCWEHTAMG